MAGTCLCPDCSHPATHVVLSGYEGLAGWNYYVFAVPSCEEGTPPDPVRQYCQFHGDMPVNIRAIDGRDFWVAMTPFWCKPHAQAHAKTWQELKPNPAVSRSA